MPVCQNLVKRGEYIRFMRVYKEYLQSTCYFRESKNVTHLDYLQLDLHNRLLSVRRAIQAKINPPPPSPLPPLESGVESPTVVAVESLVSTMCLEQERSSESTIYTNFIEQATLAGKSSYEPLNLSRVGLRRVFKASNKASSKEHRRRRLLNKLTNDQRRFNLG